MKLLSTVVFVILSVIATVHVYWAFGGLWPAQTEAELIKTVIGDPSMSHMPSKDVTLVVSGLIAIAGLIALMAGGILTVLPRWFARLGVSVLAFVFLSRGFAGYVVKLTGINLTEPFATYNLLFYSPLCLLIGGAFAVLAVKAPHRHGG